MSNRLANETSPYLLQHKDNPVDWYPWCGEAFERAKREDKPVFLSIGYSACHWCHVFAHESFEDEETAGLLNEFFIPIKVDKEERPDIDSVYMAFCQVFTGSGGWPTSIFMTAEQKPFFAGTYFPKTSQGGIISFKEVLAVIHEEWVSDREALLQQAEKITAHLNRGQAIKNTAEAQLTELAIRQYRQSFDEKNGGFGAAPKFPTPHNILFLLNYYERYKKEECLNMAEGTLMAMYRGGLFDHVGFGFCRYSTDNKFLVPHFEKMLYDNALLIMAYCKAYTVTKKPVYIEIASKTASYILKEMTLAEGGFFSAQDADSEGEEGKYYLFTPSEVTNVLGKEAGEKLNKHYDITEKGNFEGKNIPNLLKSKHLERSLEPFLSKLNEYRKSRYSLNRDEKILTTWNSLMMAAMCRLYVASKNETYLIAAENADRYIQKHLWDGEELYVSFHLGKRGVKGFLDDYAAYIMAQLALYRATFNGEYLNRAKKLCDKVLLEFGDVEGGFYLYSSKHEALILRPKEIYDGAMPSGNSLFAYDLVCLAQLTDGEKYKNEAERQLGFLSKAAARYPTNHAMFLNAYLAHTKPQMKITAVLDEKTDKRSLPLELPFDAAVIIIEEPTKEYSLKNGRTTYYVCMGNRCLPPVNEPYDNMFTYADMRRDGQG